MRQQKLQRHETADRRTRDLIANTVPPPLARDPPQPLTETRIELVEYKKKNAPGSLRLLGWPRSVNVYSKITYQKRCYDILILQ